MNSCRVHHSIILVITALSVTLAINSAPFASAQHEQFQSTVCNDGVCHSLICPDNLACQNFPQNMSPPVEPVPTGNVMEPIGQGEELIQPLEDEVAGTQAVIMEPQPEEGEQGPVVEDMLPSDESQGLVNPTTSSESGFDVADDHEPADLATSNQDTEVCEDGLDNDGNGEVDEECGGTTSLSSTMPTDLTHEEEHEEDHHEQFSEEYIRQHDGGDRAEFLQELNEKHDPPFYVPPTNS
jgi:hypothetical protein